MNIKKIVGHVTSERKGMDGIDGRIEVIFYVQSDGKKIIDKKEIITNFAPNGYVHAYSLFEEDQEIYPILEFESKQNQNYKAGHDEQIIDKYTKIKEFGFPVFRINDTILINEFSINQPILKNLITINSNKQFYLLSNRLLYGPFISEDGDIKPKTGKDVFQWDYQENSIQDFDDGTYLLEKDKPGEKIKILDCMTADQLTNWLKKQLPNFQNAGLLISLKSEIEQIALDDILNNARRLRLLSCLNSFSLNYSEFISLIESSPAFKIFFNNQLKQLENNIINEHKDKWLAPLKNEENELVNNIRELKESYKISENGNTEILRKIETVRNEYTSILESKERLIEDIKIHVNVLGFKNKDSGNNKQLITYYEETYTREGKNYDNIRKFIEFFNETLVHVQSQTGYCNKVIPQFKYYNSFISDNIESIIQVAKLSNNCKIILQQVEPDWLKFENFYKNGLKQIWESAYEHPEMLHFFVLQDINLASIECYGRPLLDVINKIRKTIPGQKSPFPDNLWIFGIPVKVSNDNFGLPLIESTFKNWGNFPKSETPEFEFDESTKVLAKNLIYDHDIPQSPNNYFQ